MGKSSFKRVFIRSTMVTAISVIASLLIVVTIVPAIGGTVDGNAWIMTIVCPLLTAYPGSGFVFYQAEKLREANLSLVEAHTALAEAHHKLAEKARRDDMTGLLNREAFLAETEQARGETAAGVLLIIDADDFKQINDTHGHLTGDDALREITAAIRCAAGPGPILGRIGGEEFGVFVAGADGATAAVLAERLRCAVEAIRFRTGGVTVPLTVSIGMSLSRRGATLSELMREADQGLYEAKRRGRNCVVTPDNVRAAA